MAKRFTDTKKWEKKWFRSLTPKMKCAWSYLCDFCDHAGVWEADFDLMKTFIGEEVTPEEIEKSFPGRVLKISEEKYILLGFISFQYKSLRTGNKVHISARERIMSVAPEIDPDALALYPNVSILRPREQNGLDPLEISKAFSVFFPQKKADSAPSQEDNETPELDPPKDFKRPTFRLGNL